MNGPEHYEAAEELLKEAEARIQRAAQWKDESAAQLVEAELNIKEAHVHAMLAVAAATARGTSTYSHGPEGATENHTSPAEGWEAIVALTATEEKK